MNTLGRLALCLAAVGAIALLSATGPAQEESLPAPGPPTRTPEQMQKEKSLVAFAKVASVLRHPRCMNCHPSGDRPHVGNDRHLHGMNVQRGPEDHGVPGLYCSACHRTENQAVPNIPGAPHWQLAPPSMGWEGLDDHDLAAMLIDKNRNGNRSLEDLLHHMRVDALVLWGWQAGSGRSNPPLSHEGFIRALKDWFTTGAALPPKGATTF
ncbi:hypothetical protein Pla175_28580 [Pirellulimonas nuda]|uniref:Cytochrome c domain-containing protein n=1 Tax=Pirellulimonas nuda TaxID=2528009 RepID=A0A518DDB9_9BACT|nr:hypothetical protein [Pirellulimonas nuda]QDU89468.1 hypothetical protein Pla175_28580 [Pirellulimonas nuda]